MIYIVIGYLERGLFEPMEGDSLECLVTPRVVEVNVTYMVEHR